MNGDPSNLRELSLSALSQALVDGSCTSEALVSAFIEQTEGVEPQVGAFLHRNPEEALAAARESDRRRAEGQPLSPLDGIPISIKDLIAVEGQPLTCASRFLEHYVSPYSATVVDKLRAAGMVLWGRLNMDEFAMGSSTETSALQRTRNPWDLNRVPGGSSGGSAAAVAARQCPASLGSDTGGSIRQPAAFCGVVGLKPSYGRVSRFGLAAFASSLDQIGPFTRTVEDAAHVLGVISGHDERDSTSYPAEVPDFAAEVRAAAPGGRRIGIPREFFGEGIDPEVRQQVQAVIDFYASSGNEIIDISLPHTDLAVPVYYVLATAEASSNLSRYDGIRYTSRADDASDGIDLYFKSRGQGFGEEVKRRIMLGAYVLSSGYYDAYYLRAQKVRSLIRQAYEAAFAKVDVILSPTTPTAAFPAGDRIDDPIAMYLCDVFTISANLAGLPAVSVPAGFTGDGLPVGFQLTGKPWAEGEILAAGAVFERAHAAATTAPPLARPSTGGPS